MPTGNFAAVLALTSLTVLAGTRPSTSMDAGDFMRIYGQKHMASLMVPRACEFRATETGGSCTLLTSRHHAVSFGVDDNVLGKGLLRDDIFPGRSLADIEAALTDRSADAARLWEAVIERVFRDHLASDEARPGKRVMFPPSRRRGA